MKLKKIHKTYHVCFDADDGTPMEVDTGCEDYQEAKEMAGKSKAQELEKVGKIIKLTSDVVTRIVSGEEITMEIALARYVKWASKNLSPRTADSHVSYSAKWLVDMGLESSTPAYITEDHVSEWLNPKASPIKASTRRVRRAALKGFLEFCHNKGWMLTKPVELSMIRMSEMTHAQKETNSSISMDEEDVKALMSIADSFWKIAVFLASETGLRLGDICSLEWDCFDGNHITVWTDKRNKRVRVEVPSVVIDALCEIPVDDPNYLFPRRRETYMNAKKRAGLSVQFKRLCNRAASETGREGLRGKSFHGLRSYYAKKNKSEGKSIEKIAEDLGHSSTDTTEIYLK